MTVQEENKLKQHYRSQKGILWVILLGSLAFLAVNVYPTIANEVVPDTIAPQQVIAEVNGEEIEFTCLVRESYRKGGIDCFPSDSLTQED